MFHKELKSRHSNFQIIVTLDLIAIFKNQWKEKYNIMEIMITDRLKPDAAIYSLYE